MDMRRFTLGTLCLLLLPGLVTSGKLLMFLVDGFRWDYIDIHGPVNKLPAIGRFIVSGVKTKYMQSSYPTESLTNYYGLTTGLYPENNGMIANRMYDRERDAFLYLFDLPNHRWPFWWDGAEPIWINAEKHSKPAQMYNWAGCEVELQGINTSFCIPYRKASWDNHKESVRKGIQALKDDTAQLIGIYVHQLDTNGHKYGPLSAQIKQGVKALDDLISFVMDELQTQGLVDDVDVMVFSDHGMTATSGDRVINATDILATDDVKAKLQQGAYTNVWAEKGKVGKLYTALKDFHPRATAALIPDLPERWHITKYQQRMPDIWFMADIGWSVIFNGSMESPYTAGRHGYDNTEQDMRGIFMATGPHFQKGVKTQPIRVVDVYQMMCHVLELEPLPNNGTWSNIQLMLQDPHPIHILRASAWSNRCGIAAVVMCLCFAWISGFMSSNNVD